MDERRNMSLNDQEDRTIAYVITLASIIGIVIVVFLVILNPSGENGFTEVYFLNHEELPKVLFVGENATFSFVIASHEKNVTTYVYRVIFNGTVVDENELILYPGEQKIINVSLHPTTRSLVLLKEDQSTEIKEQTLALSTVLVSENRSWMLGGSVLINIPPNEISLINLEDIPDNATIYSYFNKYTFGDPNNLIPVNLSTGKYVTNFGFIEYKETLVSKKKRDRIVLEKKATTREYRYEFKKVEVFVESSKGEEYSIYFWSIVK